MNYAGYSLPFIPNFQRFIVKNKKVIEELKKDSLNSFLNNKIIDETYVQKKFDTYINPFKKDIKYNNKNGYVVMHEDVLRFPNRFLNDYFKPKKTLMLNRSNINNLTGNISRLTNLYKKRAINIFRSYKNHPIFSNKEFQKEFIQLIPEILGSIIAANKLFKQMPVSCIILGTTNSITSRVLALAALEKGIPSICMQHGVIASELGYLPKISPIMAVYGKYEAEWYKNKGVAESNIEIIGHPRFDDLFERKPISRTRFEAKLGLKPKLRSVLFIIRGNQIAIPIIIIKHLLKIQKVNIIIKYHGVYAKLLTNEFPSIRCIKHKDMHLYDLIHNTDVVVSYQSTVALEAMLAGHPVFIWKSNFFCTTDMFDDMGKFLISDPLELVDMLVKYLNDEKEIKKNIEQTRKRFISYHYNTSVTSGERLKKLVLSLTPNTKPKILILSNPETIPSDSKDIHLHADIRYWSEDGSIMDILREIDIAPDFILLCGNSKGCAFAPNITNLNQTVIPKGYYAVDQLNSQKRQGAYIGDQLIDVLFTADNITLSLFPQSKIHLITTPAKRSLQQIIAYVRNLISLSLPPFFKSPRAKKVLKRIPKKPKKAMRTKKSRKVAVPTRKKLPPPKNPKKSKNVSKTNKRIRAKKVLKNIPKKLKKAMRTKKIQCGRPHPKDTHYFRKKKMKN
ncbi:hypothetical protein [Paenibacillus sp. Soil522]|uniref:hypothetical protein n=1 Tax=Paenibacillus sp. Soil522 TaxID=1736388 RepID=UPI0006F78491|nr:hypothetical protein [Paenibacillus sp. Soil522]KRE46331.1 hypothetical protein ASG81_12075 [Paenibacillus sp. Soil522]